MGGTVNINTRSPLDYKKTKFNASFTGQLEDLTDDWGDKYTISFITQNDAQPFGIALDYNYSDRLTRSDQVIIPGWQGIDETHKEWTKNKWAALAAANGLDYLFYPIDASSRVRTYDRQREGYNGTLSFRPSDNVEVNIRGFASLLDDYDTNSALSVRLRDLVVGGGRDVTKYDWEFDGPNAVFFEAPSSAVKGGWRGYRNVATLRENEWESKGTSIDLDWQLGDASNLYFAFGGNSGRGDKTTYPVVDFRDAIGFSVDLRDDSRFPQTIIDGGGANIA